MAALRIAGIELITRNLARAIEFYVEGLGFHLSGKDQQGPDQTARLLLEDTALLLRQPSPVGVVYPPSPAANDPWFQHFAIAVSEPQLAVQRIERAGGVPISTGGPVPLPPSSGLVTAWKFRDLEGHPLEISAYPDDPRAAAPLAGTTFLAFDHTALAVSDLERSADFYTRLGFAEVSRGVNQGPTQARLDGLEDPIVDILVLSCGREPHLELLAYRRPKPSAANSIADNDVAATRTLIEGLAQSCSDPDGHRLVAF